MSLNVYHLINIPKIVLADKFCEFLGFIFMLSKNRNFGNISFMIVDFMRSHVLSVPYKFQVVFEKS